MRNTKAFEKKQFILNEKIFTILPVLN
jgi:hypothetical protein